VVESLEAHEILSLLSYQSQLPDEAQDSELTSLIFEKRLRGMSQLISESEELIRETLMVLSTLKYSHSSSETSSFVKSLLFDAPAGKDGFPRKTGL